MPESKPQESDAIDQLLEGKTPDEVMTLVRTRAQEKHRAKQALLKSPPVMAAADWADRKAWLLNPLPMYGELKEFLWLALAALQADDQAEFSRQRDLLFKAVHTFIGDPPPEPKQPESAPTPA